MKMNSRFDAQLQELRQALENMTAQDLNCLREIAKALQTHSVEGLRDMRERTMEVDHAERDIETLCLRILLQRHPVASDLRQVSGTLKMITDLQRIGHQCWDFADILLQGGPDLAGQYPRLSGLADQVVDMFAFAVSACVHDDVSAARSVIQADNDVDAAYATLRMKLADDIRSHEKPLSDSLLDALMLGKYLERMADHIVLFARWVLFTATGERTVPETGRTGGRIETE